VYGMSSPRRASLTNGIGKCLSMDPKGETGNGLQQWNWDPNDKTIFWSWNEAYLAM